MMFTSFQMWREMGDLLVAQVQNKVRKLTQPGLSVASKDVQQQLAALVEKLLSAGGMISSVTLVCVCVCVCVCLCVCS